MAEYMPLLPDNNYVFQPLTSKLASTLGTSPIGGGMGVTGITDIAANATGIAKPDFFSMESFLGGNGTPGWGGAALGAASGLMNVFMGMQNYNLAKQQLAFQKQAYEKNLANQTKMTNTALEDRQRARVASNAGAYQSVSDYMRQNGI